MRRELFPDMICLTRFFSKINKNLTVTSFFALRGASTQKALWDSSNSRRNRNPIRSGLIRLTFGQTSNQNLTSRNFYRTKICALKFHGESLVVFFYTVAIPYGSYVKLSVKNSLLAKSSKSDATVKVSTIDFQKNI